MQLSRSSFENIALALYENSGAVSQLRWAGARCWRLPSPEGCTLQILGIPGAGSSPVAAVLPGASHAVPAMQHQPCRCLEASRARPPDHPRPVLHLQLSSSSFHLLYSSGIPCHDGTSHSIACMTGRYSSRAHTLQLLLVFSHVSLHKYSHCSIESVKAHTVAWATSLALQHHVCMPCRRAAVHLQEVHSSSPASRPQGSGGAC